MGSCYKRWTVKCQSRNILQEIWHAKPVFLAVHYSEVHSKAHQKFLRHWRVRARIPSQKKKKIGTETVKVDPVALSWGGWGEGAGVVCLDPCSIRSTPGVNLQQLPIPSINALCTLFTKIPMEMLCLLSNIMKLVFFRIQSDYYYVSMFVQNVLTQGKTEWLN